MKINTRGTLANLPLVVALSLLAALAPLAAALRLKSRGWFPAGDHAQAELRMRGFWDHPPQLGAAGRLGTLADQGSHPGPLAWWLMYPVYQVFGASPGSFSLAVAVAGCLWIAVSIWLAATLGERSLAFSVAIAILVLSRSLGPAIFVEPWNPWFAIFSFLATVLASALAMSRPAVGIPVAVVAGSFAVQAHVGFAPLVLVVIATGIVGALVTPTRSFSRGFVGATTALSGVGGLVLWALPIRQQLTGDPGNMTLILETFSQETEPQIGLGGGFRATTQLFDLFGPWLKPSGTLLDAAMFDPGFLLTLLIWVPAFALCIRRARTEHALSPLLQLHIVLAAGFVACVIAASRIYGDLFYYVMLFGPVLTCLVVAASISTLWVERSTLSNAMSNIGSARLATKTSGTPLSGTSLFGTSLSGTPPSGTSSSDTSTATWATRGAVVVSVLMVAITMAPFVDVETPGERYSQAVGALSAELGNELATEQTYVLRWHDPVALGANGYGLLLEMERQGFEVGVFDFARVGAMDFRVIDPAAADAALWVVTGAKIEELRGQPDIELLAYSDGRTDAEREHVIEVQDDIRSELTARGAPDLAAMLDDSYWAVSHDERFPDSLNDDMGELFDLGLPTAVFRTDPMWSL